MMSGLFKSAVNIHNQIHEHILRRRTDISDFTTPRVGQPVDVTIKFIQASGLPKMDPGPDSWADPYIIANIDGKTSYISTAQPNTLSPVWNETWMVANVPSDAKLRVDVYDKDEGVIVDDYIGFFTSSLTEGVQLQTLKGSVSGTDRGNFGFQIWIEPSQNVNIPQYSFNGPIRYSRHFSPTAGAFIKLNNPDGASNRLWSTWKISLKGIPTYFGDHHQHWNVNYKAAQTIFQGALSFTVRAPIQAGHRMLYARTTSSTFGIIENADSFWGLFRAKDDKLPTDPLQHQKKEKEEKRIKPAVYTYVIGEDETFRFSETGASFFVDFASKHALHSCCAETVRYSGEFHPRPVYPDNSGWSSFSEETPDHSVAWELVIDNNSGTYAPDKKLLPALKSLLEFNFPGLQVVVFDYKDDGPTLTQSTTACREYATKHRGVGTNQLQPSASAVKQEQSVNEAQVTLFHASKKPAEMLMSLAEGKSKEEMKGSKINGPGMQTSGNPPVVAGRDTAMPRTPGDVLASQPSFPPSNPDSGDATTSGSEFIAEPQPNLPGPSYAIPDGPPPAYDEGEYCPDSGRMPDAKIWTPPPQSW